VAQSQIREDAMQETPSIVSEIRAHHQGTALWWLGNAGWAIKSDDALLIIDPVIELANPADPWRSEIGLGLLHPLPLQAQELSGADLQLCLVTHAHGDHLAPCTIRALAERTGCGFVTPLSCRAEMAHLQVPAERIIEARHGQPIHFAHLSIVPLKANHGHEHGSVYSGANMQDCGYLISDGRWTILHPGDSLLLQEHLEMASPDVFLASISEHNLGVHHSALLANLWQPAYVLPMHYGTYAEPLFWTRGDPLALRAALDEGVRAHLVVLSQGQKLALLR
jgi:L-ascorbate 6-phosphate lactonase